MDQSASISRIVCSYCLANSPKTPHKCISGTEARVDMLYSFVKMTGPGRRAIFESKRAYITRFYLHLAENFQLVASGVELLCRYTDGSVRYWNGKGERKLHSSASAAKTYSELQKMGVSVPELLGGTDFQVDITAIWGEISPYLEA